MQDIVRLDCTGLENVRALERELAGLLADSTYDRSGGVLVELGPGGALLDAAQALGVADIFAARRTYLQGRVALHAVGDDGYVGARFIAIVGRYQGLRMEAFREVEWPVQWLTEGAAGPGEPNAPRETHPGRAGGGAGSGLMTGVPRPGTG